MIFIHKPQKIIAHMVVRNEEDIIQKTIEHNINQGVTHFIITDNNSTDKTKEILNKIPEVIEVFNEPNTLKNHSEIMTKMARHAAKYKPDWILNIDSDEFWEGFNFLKKESNEVLEVYRLYHHLTIKNETIFNKDNFPYYLDCGETRPNPRIIHKPSDTITINHGNHGVSNFSGTVKSIDKLKIDHYCIRSFEQFIKKTDKCKKVIDYIGRDWEELHDIHFNHWKLWAGCDDKQKHFNQFIDVAKEIVELNKNRNDHFFEYMLDKMINIYGVLPKEAERIIKSKKLKILEH